MCAAPESFLRDVFADTASGGASRQKLQEENPYLRRNSNCTCMRVRGLRALRAFQVAELARQRALLVERQHELSEAAEAARKAKAEFAHLEEQITDLEDDIREAQDKGDEQELRALLARKRSCHTAFNAKSVLVASIHI